MNPNGEVQRGPEIRATDNQLDRLDQWGRSKASLNNGFGTRLQMSLTTVSKTETANPRKEAEAEPEESGRPRPEVERRGSRQQITAESGPGV